MATGQLQDMRIFVTCFNSLFPRYITKKHKNFALKSIQHGVKEIIGSWFRELSVCWYDPGENALWRCEARQLPQRKGLGEPGSLSLESRSEGRRAEAHSCLGQRPLQWVDIIFQDAAVLNGVSTGTGLRRCHHADSGGQNRGSERESQDTQGSRVSQGCGRSHPKAISPHQVRLGRKCCPCCPSHVDLEKALGGPHSVWKGDRSQGPVSKHRKVKLSLQLCRYD